MYAKKITWVKTQYKTNFINKVDIRLLNKVQNWKFYTSKRKKLKYLRREWKQIIPDFLDLLLIVKWIFRSVVREGKCEKGQSYSDIQLKIKTKWINSYQPKEITIERFKIKMCIKDGVIFILRDIQFDEVCKVKKYTWTHHSITFKKQILKTGILNVDGRGPVALLVVNRK